MRKKNVVVHQPPTSRRPVKKGWEQDRSHSRQDNRRCHPDHLAVGEQHDGKEEADERDAVVQGHGTEKKTLVAATLDRKATNRTLAIDFKKSPLLEKGASPAVWTTIREASRNDLATGDFHGTKKALRRMSAAPWNQQMDSDQEPSW